MDQCRTEICGCGRKNNNHRENDATTLERDVTSALLAVTLDGEYLLVV